MTITSDNVEILCVEDDEIDALSVLREFKKVNETLKVIVAENGVQALNLLYGLNGEQKIYPPPKMILLNINMPKMGGIEFLKKLRTDLDFTHLPVYILTSSYNTQNKLVMRDLNVAGCIVKPFEYTDAINIFWNLLHER